MGDAVGTLDQQAVKAGCALGNDLHHIIQQRDEGYEAWTETWHPTVWTLSWPFYSCLLHTPGSPLSCFYRPFSVIFTQMR